MEFAGSFSLLAPSALCAAHH